MDIGTIRLWAWPVSAIVSACVGLAALGFDVIKTLQLGSLRKPLQLLAGAAGALALCAYCMNQADPNLAAIHAAGNTLNMIAWVGSAIVALCVGLAALGCNILKCLGLNSSRKMLQYLAGAAGIYALVLYYQ